MNWMEDDERCPQCAWKPYSTWKNETRRKNCEGVSKTRSNYSNNTEREKMKEYTGREEQDKMEGTTAGTEEQDKGPTDYAKRDKK